MYTSINKYSSSYNNKSSVHRGIYRSKFNRRNCVASIINRLR